MLRFAVCNIVGMTIRCAFAVQRINPCVTHCRPCSPPVYTPMTTASRLRETYRGGEAPEFHLRRVFGPVSAPHRAAFRLQAVHSIVAAPRQDASVCARFVRSPSVHGLWAPASYVTARPERAGPFHLPLCAVHRSRHPTGLAGQP